MSSCTFFSTSCNSAGDIPSKSSFCRCSVSFLLWLTSREIKIFINDKLHLNSNGEHRTQNKQAVSSSAGKHPPVPSAGKLATDHRKRSKTIKVKQQKQNKTKGQKDKYYQNSLSYPLYICVICRLGGPYRKKIVTEVLKMLLEAAGREQHFQGWGHSFLLYGPTLRRQITYLFFPYSLKSIF